MTKLQFTLALLRERGHADEQSATAIEYALIASGIAVAVVAVICGLDLKTAVTDNIASLF